MFKNLTAIIACTLIALAAGPAFANPPSDLIDAVDSGFESFQAGIDDLLNLVEPKTIFVTSEEFTGDMVTEAFEADLGVFGDGLLAADALCQNLADAPGSMVPVGVYVALLSDVSDNASARITPGIGPYVRPDGVPVAASWAALFSVDDGTGVELINHVSVDERGEVLFRPVWTGSEPGGKRFFNSDSNKCEGWASREIGRFGVGGSSFSKEEAWILIDNSTCDQLRHLYCVQR